TRPPQRPWKIRESAWNFAKILADCLPFRQTRCILPSHASREPPAERAGFVGADLGAAAAARGRARPGGEPSMIELSRFFRVPLEHIGFVRAVVEAEEGLAQLYAADSDRGEVELLFPDSRAEEAEGLVSKLTRATGWVEIPRPADWRLGGFR